MRKLIAFLQRFKTGARGAAGVELALIAPALATLLIGIVDVGLIAYARTDMHGAARSGAQYFMAGGADLDRAETIVRSAWSDMPEDSLISIDRYCECGGSTADCYALCPDGSPPDVFSEIRLTAALRGMFLEYENVAADKVRIR